MFCSVLSFIVLFCFGLSCLDLSFVLVSPVPFWLILNCPSSHCSVLSCRVVSSHVLSSLLLPLCYVLVCPFISCSVLSFLVLFYFDLSPITWLVILALFSCPLYIELSFLLLFCPILSCLVLSSHALSCPLSCLLLSCPVLPCLISWFVLSFLVLFCFDHILNCPWSCCSVLSCPLSGFVLYCPVFFYLLSCVLLLCLLFGLVLDLSSLVLFFSVTSYFVLICPVLLPKQNETPHAVPRDGRHTCPPVTSYPLRQTRGSMPNVTVRGRELIWWFSIIKRNRYFFYFSILYYSAASSLDLPYHSEQSISTTLSSQQRVVHLIESARTIWMGLRNELHFSTWKWTWVDGSQPVYR